MTPEHLGGDRWRVRVYAGIDPATKRQQQRSRSFRADGIRAARKKARTIADELEAELAEERRQYGTVADLTRRWLAAGNWSPTTRARYEAIAARITADLGQLRVDKLTAYTVDEWLRNLAAAPRRPGNGYKRTPGGTLAPRTVAHHRAVLRTVLRQGYKWEMVDSLRAVENSTLPAKVQRAEVRPPTDEVVRLLLATARHSLRPALLIAAHTGARRGEVVGLRWSDLAGDVLTIRRSVVAVKGGGVLVKPPKSGKERQVVVDRDLLAELVAWRETQAGFWRGLGLEPPADCYLFMDRTDPTGQTPHPPGWLSTAWDRHRRKHGASGVRLHDLRHWHASMLVSAGVPMTAVSKRLGHADVSTTSDIYAHALGEDDRRAAVLVGDRLGLPSGKDG